MPIYEFECPSCGDRQEVICMFKDRPETVDCRCGGKAAHIIAAGDVYCGNQDATWLKSVPDVINKDTSNPAAKEFLSNPTRSNYSRWMKSEGLRPLERNEPLKPPPVDMSRVRKEVWQKHQRRKRIEI